MLPRDVGSRSGAVDDLTDLIDYIARALVDEPDEVRVEAGARFCGTLLNEKLVDQIVLYIAPVIMGSDARGMFDLPDIKLTRLGVHNGVE